MKPLRNFFAHKFHHYRFLVVAAISLGGSFSIVMPSLADGTTSGTTINNTATADYNYVNNLGVNVLNKATSNTVTVTVAEIAGITVTPQGIASGGSPAPNNSLSYDFLITNVGNDPTRFFIPGQVTITGSATAGAITADLSNNGTFTPIPTGGSTTGSIPVNGSIKVRVPVTISALATLGSVITVLLGDTAPNDNSNSTQNQPDSLDGSNPKEVRTIDNLDGTVAGETTGIPLNGEREASAIQTSTISGIPQAFAKVLKVRSGYSDSGTANNLSDDKLTYDLSLKIDSTSPTGSTGFTPANLVGTNISVDGATSPKILVSDAIPLTTQLASVVTPPTGWTVVYTTTSTLITANLAVWTTTPPSLPMVTRIGFVNSGTLTAGTTVNGFSFQVVTNGLLASTATATINNIAQSFGQTQGNTFNVLVYDESGDQSPSNFNDDGTVTIGSNVPTTGIASVTLQGADTNNDNTGQGPGGEVNTFTITAQTSILNGPNLRPGAVGPTDNNNDFSNQSAIVPSYLTPGSTFDPAAVGFSNTIVNPDPTLLSTVLLVPVTPNTGDLPSGTTVTLTYGASITTYTYNGTVFNLTSGLGISLPTLSNVPVNYIVTVDLPGGTPLSTDTGKPFPVTIRAFVDSNNNGAFDPGESYNNTIDQVYTGFLKLVKESRILQGSGSPVATSDGTFGATVKKPGVGNIIEYRITYTNISSVPVGSNNATLNALGIIITEDGKSSILNPNNNWAQDNDNNGKVDTSHVPGTATDPAGIVTYLNLGVGVTDAIGVDITTYLDTIPGPLLPGQSGTFTFQRKVN